MTATAETRIAALVDAAAVLGGQRALAALLGVNERSVRAWLGGGRSIGDGVLRDTQRLVGEHADRCHAVAGQLAALITD